MYQFDTASIPVLQEDSKAAIAAADDALLTNSVLLTTILQTAKTADLPINITQDLYGNMIEGSVKLLEGREQLRKSIRMMHTIARQHPDTPKMLGCPVPPMAESPAVPMNRKTRVDA
ncbi:MAG: hypothetical protein ACSHW2_01070 [Parasphingopyxis sp.]